MALAIGTQLGSMEVTALIGRGGMGEVYRARDTKLKREVAIKVLPEEFSRDPKRVFRFQREAEALAAINHSNIAGIYDVQEANGIRFLVLELVLGETLAERIQRQSPLPIKKALTFAAQVAEGLEAAHRKGITHRDLKPANIKVTPEGVVKILDFGLAKALAWEQSEVDLSDLPTAGAVATEEGRILGTPGYMSPEQVRGGPVDKQTDIWAFGCVLYELLTGKHAFQRDTLTDTIAAVLEREPDWQALPLTTPASVRGLLQRCLEKDKDRRLRDIGDARIEIEEPLSAPGAFVETRMGNEPASRKTYRAHLLWSLAGLLIGALSVLVGVWNSTRMAAPAGHVLRSTIAAPENATGIHSFAISPNGRYLVFAAEVKGRRQLWLRALDAFQAQPLSGTDDATYPFWSPDSRYIGFFGQGKLKKIAASGGLAQSLCDVPDGRGGSWNREDVIVFSPSALPGIAIQRIRADGDVPADVTKAKGIYRFPMFLPDGRHFLYLATGVSGEQNGVYVGSLDGKEDRRVLPDVSSVSFAAGWLLFIRENTLMAQRFDAATAQTVGEVSPIAEGVSPAPAIAYAPVTVSETGVLLYERGGMTIGNQIAWDDRGGKLLGAVGAPGAVGEPAISPDEKSIAFRRASGSGADLWLRDLSRGAEQRFTTDPSLNVTPFWSPRGDRIVFNSNRSGGIFNLYEKAAGGTGQDELLLANSNSKLLSQWSRDGRFIVYSEFDPKTKYDIWVLPMDDGTDRKPVPLLRSGFNELFGQLSPDSHWMAFTTDESGRREVYVRPFPAGEGRWKISIVGGEQPRWRGDGKELFFAGADGKMMAVAVKAMYGAKPSFEAGVPQPLFDAHLAPSPANAAFEYDVTSDGQRFLLASAVGDTAQAPVLNMVVNWDAEPKK